MAEVYRLRLVSKSWKELVEDTPELWTYVSTNFPTVVVRDCLRWSKDRFLWVKVWHTWAHPVANLQLVEFIQLLQSHAHRWKALEYSTSIGPWIDSIHSRNFLESPAPMLQSIDVNLGQFYEEPGLNLGGGVAKELEHMTLHDAILPECSRFLHDLETFSLKNDDTVPTREVLNIFIKNPALRRFELWCESAEDQSNPLASATQRLDTVATSLDRVIILSEHPQIITQILSHVSMPRCKYLQLSADFMELDGNLQVMDQALVQFMPRIREAVSQGQRTTLVVSSECDFEWSSPLEYDGFQFSFEWSGISLGSLREWIRGLIGTLETPLELEIILTTPLQDAIETLGEWNEVTKLTIMSRGPPFEEIDAVVSLSDFLGSSIVDSVGAPSWGFPNLRELDISFAKYDLSKVFGMLNKRYLPDTDVRDMKEQGISIQTPPKIDLRVQGATEVEDATIMRALKRHWGVKSLMGGNSYI